MTDDEQAYDFEEHQKEKQKWWMLNNISYRIKLMFATAFVVIGYQLYSQSIDPSRAAVYSILGLGFIWIIAQKDNPDTLMEDGEAKMFLRRKLKQQQFDNLLPQGDIRIGTSSVTRFMDGRGWKKEISWSLIKRSGIEQLFVAELNPTFPGQLWSIKAMPFGFDGTKSPDIKFLPDRKVMAEMDRESFMFESKKRSRDVGRNNARWGA